MMSERTGDAAALISERTGAAGALVVSWKGS
jgi:hypothetical protein